MKAGPAVILPVLTCILMYMDLYDQWAASVLLESSLEISVYLYQTKRRHVSRESDRVFSPYREKIKYHYVD
jgi:hypothetical protein